MTLDMFSEKEKKSTDDSLFYTNYTFSQGSFILAGTADGLSAIGFPKTNPDIFFKNLKVRYPGHQLVKSEGPFLEAINQLEEYFNAQRQDFDLKLDLVGTAFQLRVWQYLFKIDFGTTQTYGQVARALEGNPRNGWACHWR
jgi:methylated-DNA-[protein]-cysteine S-methyltransferase